MGDIWFDNVFSDMAMHDKIQQSAQKLQRTHLQLREVLSQSLNHLRGLESRSQSTESELNDTRGRLREIRKRIMERAGESLPLYEGGAPPGYAAPPGPPPAAPGHAGARYFGNPFATALENQN
jgi:hypothetical protein